MGVIEPICPWEDVRQIGDCTLYLGNCLQIMPFVGAVEAVITDPPYADRTHRKARTTGGKKLVTFSSLTGPQFDAAVSMSLDAAAGWVVATCDIAHIARWVEQPQFVRFGAWVKHNPMPQLTGDRPGQGFEAVMILHSGKVKKKWGRGGGAGLWSYPVLSDTQVPTQKPLPLVCSLVSDFTETGQVILDPFMGSGTTGVAATRLGRRFVGIELDPKHYETACRRIEEASKAPDMFAAR